MLKKILVFMSIFSLGQLYTYFRINQIANTLAERDGQRPYVVGPEEKSDWLIVRMSPDPEETVFDYKFI